MVTLDNKGVLIVMSGPSGAGKGTLCAALKEKLPMALSISATTRQPRDGEVDGVNYFFLSKDAFEEKIKNDGFIEWAEVYGNYYGTPKAYVEEMLGSGKNVMLEIDTQGAANVKKNMPDAVLIFIMPPSYKELESRLRGRGTEQEEQIQKRLSCAIDEINAMSCYDYVIINDDIDKAVNDIVAIVTTQRFNVNRNLNMPSIFAAEKECD